MPGFGVHGHIIIMVTKPWFMRYALSCVNTNIDHIIHYVDVLATWPPFNKFIHSMLSLPLQCSYNEARDDYS